jgi:glycosyltransferase involved in cell wall biosynthesis
MKITMSYSGGTSRGRQLAREFDKKGHLQRLFMPSYGRKVDYFPAFVTQWLFGQQDIDIRKVNTSTKVRLLQQLLRRTARLRNAKPSERYWWCEAIDHWVADSLEPEADLVMVESQIALHTLRRARELGMTTILDRTNSHIAYQSEIWAEENEKMGIKWVPNSERVIEKGIREYEEADYIFALSSYVKRTFIERNVPAEKVLCVPTGIDLSPFSQLKKEDDVFRIVYCGYLQLKKGTHFLLQAFDELKLKNAELMLIGGVSEEVRPLLEKYRGVCKHIGHVNHSDLSRYYSQGSVFVIPSLEEGLAKVIIESMACGLPVIGTTNTGAEDVVREGTDGFVIPIRDVEALKEKISFMYENQELCRQMGASAKERVHAKFTLEHYVQRVLGAFAVIAA